MKQCLGDWVAKLSAFGAEQEAALSELRVILTTRVARAFHANRKVDDAFIQDVVQDGLLAILESLDDFQGRSQFTTWATTITIRIAMAEMRRRRWKDVSLDELMESQSGVRENSSRHHLDSELQRSELIHAMHEVIQNQLTEKQRTVLRAELQGMPQEEIGRRLGSNRNAIYKVGHDARKRLRKGMIEAGYSAEDLAILGEASR